MNSKLGLKFENMRKGSNRTAYWKCRDCSSNYANTPNAKTYKNASCPYCSGYKVNHTNSMLNKCNDTLLKEFNTLRNSKMPHEIYYKTGEKFWWVCEKGHDFESSLEKRVTRNQSCPYCAGVKTLRGYNDFNTINKDLSKYLIDIDKGYCNPKSSDEIVRWRCPSCKTEHEKAFTYVRELNDLYCRICKNTMSFGERIIYKLLEHISIDFIHDKALDWSERKRYDFYIPSLNTIIEVHGEQHYKNKTSGKWDGAEYHQENDKYKEELARSNGIENYIVINAIESKFSRIKKSIIKTGLMDILGLNEDDLDVINRRNSNTIMDKVIKCWNSGQRGSRKIGESIGVSKATVLKYLKLANEINLITYDPDEERVRGYENKVNAKKVVQLSLDGDYINTYNSIIEASYAVGLKGQCSGITACCTGKRNKAKGYKWMYEKDYNEPTAKNVKGEDD